MKLQAAVIFTSLQMPNLQPSLDIRHVDLHTSRLLWPYLGSVSMCWIIVINTHKFVNKLKYVKTIKMHKIWKRLPKYSKNPGEICRVKHNEMSSLRLNNGFRLSETKWLLLMADNNLRKRHFIVWHVTKTLHDSWSVLVALSRRSYSPPFWKLRRPGDEVNDET